MCSGAAAIQTLSVLDILILPNIKPNVWVFEHEPGHGSTEPGPLGGACPGMPRTRLGRSGDAPASRLILGGRAQMVHVSRSREGAMVRMLARIRRVVRAAAPSAPADSGGTAKPAEDVHVIRMLDGLEVSVAASSFRPEDLVPFLDEVSLPTNPFPPECVHVQRVKNVGDKISLVGKGYKV